MSRRRMRPDSLPRRVYERFGTRVYSVGYKRGDGTWAFRFRCPAVDAVGIARVRLAATLHACVMASGCPPHASVADLIDAWFDRQESLPRDCPSRRTDSTLGENKREAARLRLHCGHLPVGTLRRSDAHAYLDQSSLALRPRAAKANKEISLIATPAM